ncbi:MAG: M48 family metalloprotease [Terriglobales bacterium]
MPPSLTPIPAGENIFTEQQEVYLGDVMAEHISQNVTVLHDDALTAHLQQLGDRLLRYLPESKLRFQFMLVDLPEPNAFSLPGGRVYVSRKIVALTRNDDELAGILAHELGHIVTHQGAITFTRLFRETINVTQVGDQADIANKYHQYLESYRRAGKQPGGEEEGHQEIADQVAVFAVARAGYSPQAFIDIWDRFNETHGKTGSWFSDLVGTTKPSERRLREMQKNLAVLPPGCADIRPSTALAAFKEWQSKVIAAKDTHEESLPGLLSKQALPQPLRPDIYALQFSPDGKYVLAQDDGGIHILTRNPFAILFFIDAPSAYPASFSPDSHSVSFYSSSFRVETWDIQSHERSAVREVLLNEPCLQTLLAPDGKSLGCLKDDYSLTLLDVANGETLITKPHFLEIEIGFTMYVYMVNSEINQRLIHMAFSPDGRYFLAGSHTQILTYDLQQKREASLPGSIRDVLKGSFAFVGPDRIAGVNMFYGERSPLLQFPQGKRIAELPLGPMSNVQAASHGNYLLISPVKDHPLGIMSLDRRVLIAEFKHAAGDIYDNWILSERNDGEVALFDLASKQSLGAVQLSQSHLGRLEAVSVSSDFDRLAVSTFSRGAVWDLQRHTRVQLTRNFAGGWFAADDSFYVDFPKFENDERAIWKLNTTGAASKLYEIGQKHCHQSGAYLSCYELKHPNSYERTDLTVEVSDVLTQQSVWRRYFPKEAPIVTLQPHQTALLAWPLTEGSARDEIDKFPDLKGKAEREDFLVEIFDLTKDTMLSKMLLKTGKRSFAVRDADTDGDWMVISTSGDQALVYSLATGEEKAHVFGHDARLSAAAGKFTVLNPADQINFYELGTGSLQKRLRFQSQVAFENFSSDGKRLFVLTRDQTVYVLDVSTP